MAAEVLPVRLAASGGVMVLLGRVELVEQRQPLEQQLGVIGQRVFSVSKCFCLRCISLRGYNKYI